MCSPTDKAHNAALSPTQMPTSGGRVHTSTCMQWYYQLKVVHLPSSNRIANSPAQCRRLCHFMALLALALILWDKGACAAPQSCILCDKEDLKAKDPGTNYEEFLFEHQVTRQDAINALKALNDSFYVGPSSENSCKSVTCTKTVMRYCLGPQFINDHCWCEFSHTDEGLPFVPHLCYVGEKLYTASVGSCFLYEEFKECCCAPALAKEWRHISAAPRPFSNCPSVLSATLLILLLAIHCLRSGCRV